MSAVLALATGFWGALSCGPGSSTTSSGTGGLALSVAFVQGTDLPSSGADLARPAGRVRQVRAVVTDGAGSVLAEDSTLVAAGEREFSLVLPVPPGDGLVVAVEGYEDSEDQSGELSLTYRGETRGIRVRAGLVSEYEITLWPTPVRGRRVVLRVEDSRARLSTGHGEIEVSLANLDSLRALQFDLVYPAQWMLPSELSLADSSMRFSDITGRIVSATEHWATYRVLMFDQNSDSLRIGTSLRLRPVIKLSYYIINDPAPGQSEIITLAEAVAAAHGYQALDVVAINGRILIEP